MNERIIIVLRVLRGKAIGLQSSVGSERRGKGFEIGWTCLIDIDNEAVTTKAMVEKLVEKLIGNNLPKNGVQVARSFIIPTTC